jgi:signal transduction histidine kinase
MPKLSTCVAVLFAVTIIVPWCVYAWLALQTRSEQIVKAEQSLAALAAAHGAQTKGAANQTAALSAAPNAPQVHFSERRIATSDSTFGLELKFNRANGTMSAEVDRSATRIATIASVSEDEVLNEWRSRVNLAAMGLLLRTLIAIVVGTIVVHQLRWREAAQAELLSARKAAEASTRVKAEFLANMSHELRTPLNAIIGFSEVIKAEMLGPLSARYREYGGYIFGSGNHLLELINEILDLSKLEAGQFELREEHVDLSAAIAAAMRLVEPQAEKSNIRLSKHLENDLPLIRGDNRRIRQVLINLIANAVKFTPEGGRVHVSLRRTNDGLSIRVNDTGVGMLPEDIPKAFEPFRQLKGQVGGKYEGTGLGLPLAKHLVELHGGTLTIASQIDAGTTATIILPPERVITQSERQFALSP